MRLIPEETFEEMLADKNLPRLVEFCTKRCAEHGQDFDLLFRSSAVQAATKKIKRCLQPGQWEKFIELWNDSVARTHEARNDPRTAEALEQEMEKILGIWRNPDANMEIMQAADKIRKSGGFRPFNSEWINSGQLSCSFAHRRQSQNGLRGERHGYYTKQNRPVRGGGYYTPELYPSYCQCFKHRARIELH